MCEENVDSDCSIDCSSPISAKTLSKAATDELLSHGMFNPDFAISVISPTVFKLTVLPPVFGPVIISDVYSSPSSSVVGTTLSFGINGCLAFFRLT